MTSQLFDVKQCYNSIVCQDPETTVAVAAMRTLVELIKNTQATTMTEFMLQLTEATNDLKSITKHVISLEAGCQLFLQFVARTKGTGIDDFETIKSNLSEKGGMFVEKAYACRDKIAGYGADFIRDDTVILIHSYSRVVLRLLQRAAEQKRRFKVYVTESRPTSSGLKSAQLLRNAGIPTEVILDSAVGYVMEKVDMVFVGAEGVVENGGLVNQIGTYQIAIVAKAAKKPFYAVAESFKFVRIFPLNQYDLPLRQNDKLMFSEVANRTIYSGHPSGCIAASDQESIFEKFEVSNPTVDYTPPEYITLLLTDLGIITPSGVSDQLIRFYC